MTILKLYGWFEKASQINPTYDPPHNIVCPWCWEAISPNDIRTHSLMFGAGPERKSYFYRTHRTCDVEAKPRSMDSVILQMIEVYGD